MISIIISSQKEIVLKAVSDSINQTIGVLYEIISIENSSGQLSICEAYNIGAAKAKFDIFCFMHEDVLFETINWGQAVVKHFNDKSVGLIGVAGGDTKSLVPSSWSSSVFQSEISIIQHNKNAVSPARRIVKTGYPEDKSNIKGVVCIDGVWMCTTRQVFNQFKFDSDNFRGFHGYDVDYSLQVFSRYKVCVVFDVLMHHFSEGAYSEVWMENMIKLSTKWSTVLPLSVRNLSEKEWLTQHWTTLGVLLEKLSRLNYSRIFILKLYFKYSVNHFFYLPHFLHFLKRILLNRLRDIISEPSS